MTRTRTRPASGAGRAEAALPDQPMPHGRLTDAELATIRRYVAEDNWDSLDVECLLEHEAALRAEIDALRAGTPRLDTPPEKGPTA